MEKTKKNKGLNNFDEISTRGCIEYFTSWIETLQSEINSGDPKSILYEEQIAFLKAAVNELRTRS